MRVENRVKNARLSSHTARSRIRPLGQNLKLSWMTMHQLNCQSQMSWTCTPSSREKSSNSFRNIWKPAANAAFCTSASSTAKASATSAAQSVLCSRAIRTSYPTRSTTRNLAAGAQPWSRSAQLRENFLTFKSHAHAHYRQWYESCTPTVPSLLAGDRC